MAAEQPQTETWIEFLASNRLAIYTLSGLAAATLIGTIVPQRGPGLTEEQYTDLIAKGGLYQWADKLGVYEVFHSPWFLALVMILCVNLIVCTITRMPQIVKPDHLKGIPLGAKFLQRFGKRYDFRSDFALDDAAVRRHFRFRRTLHAEEGRYYYAESGRLKRYSVIIIHIAILIVCGAAIASKNLYIDGSMAIPTSEVTDTVVLRRGGAFRLPFTVRCDAFDVQFYEGTQRPKTFRSDLTFTPAEGEPMKTTLLVNHPARFGGFRFYQASYGPLMPRPIIRVSKRETGEVLSEGKLVLQKPYSVPDGGGAVFGVVTMRPDKDGLGPAALILMAFPDQKQHEFWIYKTQPDMDEDPDDPLRFEFLGAEMGGYYTGIMVSRNDAFPALLFGCLLGFFGVLINFFLPHKRTILFVSGDNAILAGTDSRGILMLEERLETLRDRLSGHRGPSVDTPAEIETDENFD